MTRDAKGMHGCAVRRPLIALAFVLLAALLGTLFGRALAGADALALPWSAVSGGAVQAQAGQFALTVSAGQTTTGTQTGGRYGMMTGFLAAEKTSDLPGGQPLYLPLVRR
jgi:hypothetical protein